MNAGRVAGSNYFSAAALVFSEAGVAVDYYLVRVVVADVADYYCRPDHVDPAEVCYCYCPDSDAFSYDRSSPACAGLSVQLHLQIPALLPSVCCW